MLRDLREREKSTLTNFLSGTSSLNPLSNCHKGDGGFKNLHNVCVTHGAILYSLRTDQNTKNYCIKTINLYKL